MNPIVQKRITKIRQELADKELDALMVSVQENRYYLSGFTGEDTQFDESAGMLIISDRRLVLATDSRYELQAQAEAAGFDIVCYKKGLEKELPDIVKSLGIHRLGFESVRLSHKNHSTYVDVLGKQNPPVELIPTENVVEALRQFKSEDEIQRTINALRLAEKAFLQVLDVIEPGMTERQAAWVLEKNMRENGAQGLSFPVIVASGPNSALPHAVPTDRQMAMGEPILFDWGARLNEYCSDTTRTVIMGEPDDCFKKVYQTVVTARDLAIDAIKAGASGIQVDMIARNYINQNGYEGKFGHSLGHGTGLAVHEGPRLSPIKDDRLEAGMVVTVEPGIYLPGWGGVRMENQVVVRQDGAQVLNDPTPFDPRIRV
ncbi:aminopeptidase P family protein [uncultured Desulfosarcina sp.]|uniref:M24 family metallopeptidase n=1 Tax=uncultured Desulfosarcina sp. TaxID=218289 RepID=UPI0029C80B45|nr:aminopeptidase P family protein [uncultured Desulfosarcina sp.]